MSDFRNLTSPKIVVEPPGPRVSNLMKLGLLKRYTEPVMEEAQGIFIKDLDGNIFVDLISGKCVVNIGHNHPKLVDALKTQVEKGVHGLTEHRLKLDVKLSEITPGGFKKRVFYAQSGSATVDFGIKTARWSTRRPYIVAFTGAYHGTTYGALSVSSYRPEMVKGFNPNLPGIYHVPYPYCYRCPFKLEHPDCSLACL